MAKKAEPAPIEATEAAGPPAPPDPAAGMKKRLIWIGVITALVWAFAIQTGSMVLMIIVGVLTLALLGVILWAYSQIKKQRRMVGLLHGSTASADARRDALAQLSGDKDAKSPAKLFARAQLMAADDPKGALDLINGTELKAFPANMQDDVSLLRVQLFLGMGRTQDARKAADTMNLDNPSRKEVRALAASMVAEAWARTGKPKEAMTLLDSIELPAKDKDQIELQIKVARVFARFAANQRAAAKKELEALADLDPNYLGRFVAPQFRVHPELGKLAKQVFQSHPSARRNIKMQNR
ncbi:MAG: hypothetical protein NT062_31440 [Proteobacteria bacterium]|nr:hypothetical protein [Pseudomonadota bacterium]